MTVRPVLPDRPRPTGHRRAPGRRGAAVAALAALATALLVLAAVPAAAVGRAAAPAVTAPGAAWIRAGHFVPGFGAGRIDLTPGSGPTTGIVMSPDARYGDVTGYQKVAPGPYTVTLRLAGKGLDTAPLLERTFTLTAGSASTVAAIGSLTAPRLSVLTDDLTPPPAGDARVRVLAAASRLPTLTVTAQDGPTLATGAVLGQVTPYSTVPRGSWPLAMGSGGPAMATQDVALASGTVYTAVVLDTGASSVAVKLVTDAVGSSVTPVGGARTGEGGLALGAGDGGSSGSTGVLALAAVAAGLALAAAAAARRRTATPGRHRG